jgi:hypothetical protein
MSCNGDILARESCCNEITISSCKGLNVVMDGNPREIFRQNFLAKWINLDKLNSFNSANLLRRQSKATNAAKQINVFDHHDRFLLGFFDSFFNSPLG